jgi:hypothetical protein
MSGRLQLAGRGLQNELIDGTPTQSNFLFSLKKHTKFAFDTLEIPVTGADYGKESICFIPLDAGDLITGMTLRYNLNFASRAYRDALRTVGVTRYPAVHLIDHIDLYIGGMHIQRLTSQWLELYNKIAYERALYEANKESANFVRGEIILGYPDEPVPPVYIDLPFYFHDNLKSSLLTCKLQKQNCYIKIKFKSLSAILRPSNFAYISSSLGLGDVAPHLLYDPVIDSMNENIKMGSVSILTKYAYLNREEVNYLKSRPIEQVITQLQLKRFDVPIGETKRVQLNFKHPVKTLYFFIGSKNPISKGINYMDNIKFTNAKLLFNNQIVFDEGPEKLIYYNSKTNTYSGMYIGIPSNYSSINEKMETGTYSFAMYPLKKEPTGHVNFSRIINQEFEITIPETEDIGGGSYIDQVNECQIYAESYNILHYSSGLAGLKF